MLKRPFIVAANLFSWASEQGFIGVAVYIACWVFMFPVMVVICIGGAIFGWMIDNQNHADLETPSSSIARGKVERERWAKEDRRYEAAKAALIKKLRIQTDPPPTARRAMRRHFAAGNAPTGKDTVVISMN